MLKFRSVDYNVTVNVNHVRNNKGVQKSLESKLNFLKYSRSQRVKLEILR